MTKYLALMALWLGVAAAQPGNLSVRSERAGSKVYLDNELIGTTPIVDRPVEPGEHWLSFFPTDSSEERYNDIANGDIGTKLAAVWYLARIGKGTVRVTITPGEKRSIFLSTRAVERAPTEAKWLATGCISAPFILGVAIGIVVMLLAGGK
jgi:hypothetical protein